MILPTSSTFAVKRKPLQNSQTLSSHHKNWLVHGHVPQDPSIQWIVYTVSGKKIDNTWILTPPTWCKFPPDFPNLDPFPVEHPISQPPSVPSPRPAAPNSAATLRRPSTRRPRLKARALGNWSCGGTRWSPSEPNRRPQGFRSHGGNLKIWKIHFYKVTRAGWLIVENRWMIFSHMT